MIFLNIIVPSVFTLLSTSFKVPPKSDSSPLKEFDVLLDISEEGTRYWFWNEMRLLGRMRDTMYNLGISVYYK